MHQNSKGSFCKKALLLAKKAPVHSAFRIHAGDLGLRSHDNDFNPGLHDNDFNPGLGFSKFQFALSKIGMAPAGGRVPQNHL